MIAGVESPLDQLGETQKSAKRTGKTQPAA
jgi:hypothetical protein